MYQKTTLIGRVGKDAELAYTPTGIAVSKFSLAVSRVTGKGESRQEKTTWFRVSIWREKAENLNQYIKKGGLLMVEGEISVNAYIGKDGQPAASLELTAHEIKLLSSKEDGGRGASDPADGEHETGDIPF